MVQIKNTIADNTMKQYVKTTYHYRFIPRRSTWYEFLRSRIQYQSIAVGKELNFMNLNLEFPKGILFSSAGDIEYRFW